MIYHWMRSGVAWVPWRMQEALRSIGVESALCSPHPPGLRRYGLPGNVEPAVSVSDLRLAAGDSLIVHHDFTLGTLGSATVVDLQDRGARVVCVVHGEPDRATARRGHRRGPIPDAWVHVSRDTWRTYEETIPEHRGRGHWIPNFVFPEDTAAEPPVRAEKLLVVPWSAVPQWKSGDALADIARGLRREGWEIRHLPELTNPELRRELRTATACWVQFEGYAPDLLTQECWQAGCVPLVGIAEEDRAAVQERFRYPFLPAPFDREAVLGRLRNAATELGGNRLRWDGLEAVGCRSLRQYAEELRSVFAPAEATVGR